jgi:hypothetical protein
MDIFSIWIIYNDLLKVGQRLINNKSSGHIKLMIYFMWPYNQCTSGHAIIQNQIVCIKFCMNLAWFEFMNFYTE